MNAEIIFLLCIIAFGLSGFSTMHLSFFLISRRSKPRMLEMPRYPKAFVEYPAKKVEPPRVRLLSDHDSSTESYGYQKPLDVITVFPSGRP